MDLIDHTLHYSQIEMQLILKYRPRSQIPHIEMTIIRQALKERKFKYVEVKLTGVEEPNSFTLLCTYGIISG